MGAVQCCSSCHAGPEASSHEDIAEGEAPKALRPEEDEEAEEELGRLDAPFDGCPRQGGEPPARLPPEALGINRAAASGRPASLDDSPLSASPGPKGEPRSGAAGDGGGSCTASEGRARELLAGLRVCEAAAELEAADREAGGEVAGAGKELRDALDLQLRALGAALERLAGVPGLSGTDASEGECLDSSPGPDVLLGVPVPTSPASLRGRNGESGTAAAEVGGARRDVLEVGFDLDAHGRRVEAVVEFFPDGAASIRWTAFDLPIPMPYVVCLVNEIDLLGEVVPFIVSSGVLHQFTSNEADRLVRVVSRPPIPFVAGFEGIAQRFGFDLLDTPWEALCLVEVGPEWERPAGATADEWRSVPRPPPFKKGLKEVDVKSVVALGRPSGPDGQLSTILFSGKGVLKVPRSLLPNWLITWLVKTTGRLIFQQALERVAAFDSSKFGPRLKDSSLYGELHRRIAEFADGKAAVASRAA